MPKPPFLVLAVGNPSRGDDALGSLFLERAEVAFARAVKEGSIEFLTDFQLQPEHTLDLADRNLVVFVDASTRALPPFLYERVEPRQDATFSTHSLSPAALLDIHRRVAGDPPESWVLAIRGESFKLGDGLSPAAARHLEAASRFFLGRFGSAHA